MYFNYNDITFTGVLGKSIIESLRITDFDKFLSSLQSMFASIPAEHFKNLKYRESFFHTHLYILLTSLGLTTFMEKQHSKGKSDLIIKFNNNYFIIEIKEDLPSKSIEQIKDKGYYTEFREKPGSIFLIGLQTSIEQRNFVDIKAEMV